MVDLTVLPEEIRAKMRQLQEEIDTLRESFDDVTLTKDDLDAIEEGFRDFELNRTRRL